MAVGSYESSGTKLYSAEISGDYNNSVSKTIFLDGFQDWISSGSPRLPIIVGFLFFGIFPKYPGGAVVSCIEVFLFHGQDKGLGFLLGADTGCVGYES